MYFFGPRVCGSPTAGDAIERKASCSPPRWGGGELRAGVTPVLRKAHRYSGRGLRRDRVNERMRIAGLRGAEATARAVLRTASQNLSSAATGVAPKVRAAEDNTAERCACARESARFAEPHIQKNTSNDSIFVCGDVMRYRYLPNNI